MHDVTITKWFAAAVASLYVVDKVQPVLQSILQCSGTETNHAGAATGMEQHSTEFPQRLHGLHCV